MSTRATIRFADEYETFFVYRHCDGFPDVILPDLQKVIERKRGAWSDPEAGMLVTCFLALMFDEKARLPDYSMTSAFHGDESYRYSVTWDAEGKKWVAMVER